MTFPKARIAVATLLLVGWLGYLLVLVVTTRDPVILSRPQILVSNLGVVAKVTERDGGPDPRVHVIKVLWPADHDTRLEGRELLLEDLADVGAGQGWSGDNEYLIPLTARKHGQEVAYEVTPLPPLPLPPVPGQPARLNDRRIYRVTDDTLRQFRELRPNRNE